MVCKGWPASATDLLAPLVTLSSSQCLRYVPAPHPSSATPPRQTNQMPLKVILCHPSVPSSASMTENPMLKHVDFNTCATQISTCAQRCFQHTPTTNVDTLIWDCTVLDKLELLNSFRSTSSISQERYRDRGGALGSGSLQLVCMPMLVGSSLHGPLLVLTSFG